MTKKLEVKTWADVAKVYGHDLSRRQLLALSERFSIHGDVPRVPAIPAQGRAVPVHSGPKSALRWLSRNYHIDAWADQNKHVEVVLEHGCMAVSLLRYLDVFRVEVSSIFRFELRDSTRDRIDRAISRKLDTIVLYVGLRPPTFALPAGCRIVTVRPPIPKGLKPGKRDASSFDPNVLRRAVVNALNRLIELKRWNESINHECSQRARLLSLAESYYQLCVGYDEKINQETLVDPANQAEPDSLPAQLSTVR